MRTLHPAYRITDLATSLAFYGAIGFEQVGRVDVGDGATLTMLKFPADEVVTLELVHRPADGPVVIGSGFSHLAVQVDDLAGTIEAVTKAGLSAGQAERHLTIWFVRYVIAVVALALFVVGDILFALLLIALSEFVFITLRPRPKLSASTFRPPAPDQWQTPITALRWTSLISSVWAIATGAVVLTIAMMNEIVVLIVRVWRHGLDARNFAVLALFGVWLLTRPLWI